MTDEAHEPVANLSLRVTVPLLAKLMEDNPELCVELSDNVVRAAVKKLQDKQMLQELEAALGKKISKFKSEVEIEIMTSLGAEERPTWSGRTWKMTETLRRKIASEAESKLRDVVINTLRTDRITEIVESTIVRLFNRQVEDRIYKIVDDRIRKNFQNFGRTN